MANIASKVLNIEGIVPLFIRIRNLHIRPWSVIVESLATEQLLGTSFIDGCISLILPSAQEVVPWHLRPATIIKT